MKIKVFNNIAKEGLGVFSTRFSGAEVSTGTSEPDAVILRSHKLKLEECGRAVAVGRAGAGVNNVPVDELSERGVVVFNTPGANANAVAELVFGALLVQGRNLNQVFQDQTLKWWVDLEDTHFKSEIEKLKKQYRGHELAGKTLGVVGLGAIGRRVANLALQFGMAVKGYDPYLDVRGAWQIDKRVRRVETMEQLFTGSNYVSLHIPLTPHTEKSIDSRWLKLMEPNSVLVNFSRGGIVNDSDVEDSLEKGLLGRYITDFPDKRWAAHPRVVWLPHLGASTTEAESNCAVMAANQLCDYWEDGTIRNGVNFPDISMPFTPGTHRVVWLHRHKTGVLKTIASAMADRGMDIVEMSNRAKGDYAVTLADVTDVKRSLYDAEDEEDILRVRLI